jgi:hypothetical protein
MMVLKISVNGRNKLEDLGRVFLKQPTDYELTIPDASPPEVPEDPYFEFFDGMGLRVRWTKQTEMDLRAYQTMAAEDEIMKIIKGET